MRNKAPNYKFFRSKALEHSKLKLADLRKARGFCYATALTLASAIILLI